jgi:hypothetical protein
MSETEQLIHRIRELAKRLDRSPSTLSAKVLGGGQVLADLESGKTITLAKYERANALLSEMEKAA